VLRADLEPKRFIDALLIDVIYCSMCFIYYFLFLIFICVHC